MITNKRSQELLMLATTGKKLNKDVTEEEKKFYEECKHDYEVMHETAKKHGIKNPILEISMEEQDSYIQRHPFERVIYLHSPRELL